MSEEINRERLRGFLGKVRQEISNIQAGEGKFTPVAIHFDKGGASSPVMASLSRLEEHPSSTNLKLFIEATKQDLGVLTADAFATWGVAIFSDTEQKEEKQEMPIEQQVFNCFYEVFKSSGISIGIKQVERLEKASDALLKIFEKVAKETIKEEQKKFNPVITNIVKEHLTVEISKLQEIINKRFDHEKSKFVNK